MTDLSDLFLASPLAPEMIAELEKRFRVHRDSPPPTTRVIVGSGMTRVDAARVAALPALELVAIQGVGYDGLDLGALRARGVAVTTTPDVLSEDVADLAIALMLAAERRIAANDAVMRAGGWAVPFSRRASGRRIGIFGLGRIGQAIARRAAPFASELLYSARHEKPGLPWRFVGDIGALAEACDVLVLAAPGGDGTRGIVDAAVLEKLGADGVLVNIARGSLVDEPALVAALKAGTIRGAGLDVFAEEPHVSGAFREMDQVVLSPHQASATVECRAEMAALVLANLDAYLAGKRLLTPLG